MCFLCILQSPTDILILHLWAEIKAQRNTSCSYCENGHLTCCLTAPPSVFSSFSSSSPFSSSSLPLLASLPSLYFLSSSFLLPLRPQLTGLPPLSSSSLLLLLLAFVPARPYVPWLVLGSLTCLAFALPWPVSGSVFSLSLNSDVSSLLSGTVE